MSDVVGTPPQPAERNPVRHNPPVFFNLPTLLTWARILAIPLVIGANSTGMSLFGLIALPFGAGFLATILLIGAARGLFGVSSTSQPRRP